MIEIGEMRLFCFTKFIYTVLDNIYGEMRDLLGVRACSVCVQCVRAVCACSVCVQCVRAVCACSVCVQCVGACYYNEDEL